VPVTPVELQHGRIISTGWRIGGLAYLTDANDISPRSLALLQGLDLLVIDGLRERPHPTHFSIAEAVAVARELRPKRTFLTHMNHDVHYARTMATLPDGVGLAHDGLIVDLRDPSAPKLLDEKWTDGTKLDPGYPSHDLIELRPGVLLTSSNPMLLLDARKDIRHPKILAQGDPGDSSFIHSAMWPRGGRDSIMMSAGETNATPRCELGSAAFLTWDARNWRHSHSFKVLDSYKLTNGTATDGSPPANGMGCSTHWFQHNPKFHDGGIVALGAYDHGTRFLHVSSAGEIEEAGYFLPTASETSAAHWITDRIVYSIDYTRGIDILRYTGSLK
jgi:hypothetical protein